MAKSKYDRTEAFYATLEDLMAARKQNLTVLEVGCGNGHPAAELCKYWREQTDGAFKYVGFENFQAATKEHAKAVLTRAGTSADLIDGEPQDTVPAFVQLMRGQLVPDLILFRYDAPAAAVEAAWYALAALVTPDTTVLFDYCYEDRPGHGCRDVVDRLRKNPLWRVDQLPQLDEVGGYYVRVVAVTRLRQGRRAA